MIAYAPLVGELDQQVEGVLTRQVLDADSPYCGGFVDQTDTKSAVGSGRTRGAGFYRRPPTHRTPRTIICCMPRLSKVPGPWPNAV